MGVDWKLGTCIDPYVYRTEVYNLWYMGSATYGPSQLVPVLHRKNTLRYQLKIRKIAEVLTEYS